MDTPTFDEIREVIDSIPHKQLLVNPALGPYYRYQQSLGRFPAEPYLKIVTNPSVPRDQVYLVDPTFLREIK
jgi:hypothetical protein